MGSAGYGAESCYKSIVTVSANHFYAPARDHHHCVLPRYGEAAEGAVVADRRRLMHEKSKNNQTADSQSKSGLLLLMAVGIGIALGAVALFIFTLKVPVNLVMAFVFVELLIFVGLAVIRINGMNLFKWIIVMFQSPIFRPYQSKGVLDRYEEEKEE